jgi:hypothetical protein
MADADNGIGINPTDNVSTGVGSSLLQLQGVGSDHKRDKKEEKPQRKQSTVGRFDAKFIDGTFFERKVQHKVDDRLSSETEEFCDVWAIDKGELSTWMRGKRDVGQVLDSEVQIKTEPGERITV